MLLTTEVVTFVIPLIPTSLYNFFRISCRQRSFLCPSHFSVYFSESIHYICVWYLVPSLFREMGQLQFWFSYPRPCYLGSFCLWVPALVSWWPVFICWSLQFEGRNLACVLPSLTDPTRVNFSVCSVFFPFFFLRFLIYSYFSIYFFGDTALLVGF